MYAQPSQFSQSQGHIPHACIGMKVVFMNGTQKWYYSYDANFQGKREYHNQAHWIKKFQDMCEFETPKNWKEYRVLNAGMFEMFQGKLGDKIGQFDRGAGWQMQRVVRR